jgi:hypothetical protein
VAYSSAMKMKEAGSFKTLVSIYQTTWHHILEDSNILNITGVGLCLV